LHFVVPPPPPGILQLVPQASPSNNFIDGDMREDVERSRMTAVEASNQELHSADNNLLGCDRNRNAEKDDDSEETDDDAPDFEGAADPYQKGFRNKGLSYEAEHRPCDVLYSFLQSCRVDQLKGRDGPLKRHGLPQGGSKQMLTSSLMRIVTTKVNRSGGSLGYDRGIVFLQLATQRRGTKNRSALFKALCLWRHQQRRWKNSFQHLWILEPEKGAVSVRQQTQTPHSPWTSFLV
jgi:hypothetical protein